MSDGAPLDPADLPPAPGDAVADIRATAKWTIGAAAAVGALLLGGAPLAAINKIHGTGHIALAVSGLALALAAVAWIIRQAGETLMPRVVSLSALDDPDLADLRRLIEAEPVTFYGPFGTSAAELAEAAAWHDTVAANTAYLLARETDSARIRILEQTLADARANARAARLLQYRLVQFVHAWKVRGAVRAARRQTLGGAFVVLIGASLFFAASAPETPAKSNIGPTPVRSSPAP
ncbi:hypothetical protein GCM10023195_14290 [Actinoallomurus liliacearum]|uniref:Uncharacterized protein n=1 Tax=Actinoallomurus liliacearum TaxID=1080073 RepID=A0ABP8TG82_9ACTN